MSIKRLVPLNLPALGALPSGAGKGDLVYLTTDDTVYVFDGDAWTAVVTGGPASAENVWYVSKSGNDSNDGRTLSTAKLTIKAAVTAAGEGASIFVKAGTYYENNPVQMKKRQSIIGDSLRTVNVHPNNTTSDIFYVQNGTYLTGMTFRGHVSPAYAVAFNPDGSAGMIVTSPYIQNCSSITTTGGGMFVDGSKVLGVKSMVVDSYTQFNQGGPGVVLDNQAYAQLVSLFTICCSYGIWVKGGSSASVTNSNNSFGTYALVAEGVGAVRDTGTVVGDSFGTEFTISGVASKPLVNEAVTFDGGTTYFTIGSSTTPVAGVTTITLLERVRTVVPNGTSATFRPVSFISASGQTFEYVGSGTSLTTALPAAGGVPVQANEVVELSGGKVFFTSTDQFGDFRIGGELNIERGTGTITGRAFDRSLFATLTPYILAIEGT